MRPIEIGLRGVVVGRKNHYGSKTRRGTEVAALFYSLIESAKLGRRRAQGYAADDRLVGNWELKLKPGGALSLWAEARR